MKATKKNISRAAAVLAEPRLKVAIGELTLQWSRHVYARFSVKNRRLSCGFVHRTETAEGALEVWREAQRLRGLLGIEIQAKPYRFMSGPRRPLP